MINQELIDYINSEEAQGYTEEQLREYLLEYGYAEKDVAEAFEYLHSQQPAQQPAQPVQDDTQPQGQAVAPAQHKPQEMTEQEILAKNQNNTRPIGVTIIAICFFITGFVFIFSVLMDLVVGMPLINTVINPVGGMNDPAFLTSSSFIFSVLIIVFIAGIISILIAFYLLKLKRWARIAAIISLGLSIILFLRYIVVIPLRLRQQLAQIRFEEDIIGSSFFSPGVMLPLIILLISLAIDVLFIIILFNKRIRQKFQS